MNVEDGSGQKRKLYSNTSWMDEDARHKLFKLLENRTYCARSAGVVTIIGMLEAVSRVKFFWKYPLQHRAGIVLVPGLLAYLTTGFLYGKMTEDTTKKLIAQGNTPFWKDQHRVPELDKVFFELDDHKNFEPNILHHGLSERQLNGFYPEMVISDEPQKSSSSSKTPSHSKH